MMTMCTVTEVCFLVMIFIAVCFGEHLIYNHHLSLTSDWKYQADSTVRGQAQT